jgi:predicted 2-oxoglutarate/Fe(II)-dependent dioxygenase YbiX
MKKNLDFYVRNYKSWLDKPLCDETVKQLKTFKAEWNEHTFYNRATKKEVKLSGSKELSTMYTDQVTTNNEIMDKFWYAIHDYILKYLRFSWFDSWDSYSFLRYNKYKKNKQMAQHCDHITNIFDGTRKGVPILSVLCSLNDDYSGGEFIMQGKKLDFEKGDVLVFPSNFLFPHEVKPVKKGTRYSAISWTW